LIPINASGASVGLTVNSTAGQPHRMPPATRATIQMSEFPHRYEPIARGHMSRTSIAQTAHGWGLSHQMTYSITAIDTPHQNGAPRMASGTNNRSIVGGYVLSDAGISAYGTPSSWRGR
jgi:hypothetical protein